MTFSSGTSLISSSTELLTSRRNGYGLAWIAATLSTRTNLTSFKKLSKKDILNFSIPSFCQTLQNPPEPLALRLSSNLLIGIVRIYDKRTMFFHHDVQQVHNNLVKATASIDNRSKGERVNLLHDRARAEHITLDVNRLHGPDDVQGLDLRLELADMDINNDVILFEDSYLASLTGYDSHSSEIGRARPVQQEYLFDPLIAMDWSASSHAFDPVILSTDMPQQFDQSVSQHFVQDKPPSKRIARTTDDWGMPIDNIPRDFFDDVAQAGKEGPLGDNFFNFELSAGDLSNHPEQVVGGENTREEDNAQAGLSSPLTSIPQNPRPLKRRRLMIDARIELFDNEIKQSRDNYVENMEIEKAQCSERSWFREEERIARALVTELPFNIRNNSSLVPLFPDSAIIHAGKTRKYEIPLRSFPSLVHQTEHMSSIDGWQSSLQGVDFNFGATLDQTNAMQGVQAEDIEVGRAMTASPRDRLPWERSAIDIGLGRPSTASPVAPSLHRSVSMKSGSRRFSLDLVGSTQRRPSIRSPAGGSITAGDFLSGLDQEASLAGLEEALLPEPGLDSQTNSFLRFTRDLWDSNGGTGPIDVHTGVPSLTMNDICPKTLTTRYVAANAFHNLLVLADKDMIKVDNKDDSKMWSIRLV
ncbi:hypothetical protein E3Q11_02640 [Wallemia mellicola]|nr:hypothetical protein E3Q11_02640 [Wallemia mellicola]